MKKLASLLLLSFAVIGTACGDDDAAAPDGGAAVADGGSRDAATTLACDPVNQTGCDEGQRCTSTSDNGNLHRRLRACW